MIILIALILLQSIVLMLCLRTRELEKVMKHFLKTFSLVTEIRSFSLSRSIQSTHGKEYLYSLVTLYRIISLIALKSCIQQKIKMWNGHTSLYWHIVQNSYRTTWHVAYTRRKSIVICKSRYLDLWHLGTLTYFVQDYKSV